MFNETSDTKASSAFRGRVAAAPGTGTEAAMGEPALLLNHGKSWTLTHCLSSAVAGQDRFQAVTTGHHM